jgi:putative SOS response-associated peptidase YedK
MPAFLAKDNWATWLGENGASSDEAKACLKKGEGIKWTMSREERAVSKAKQGKPTVSDPTGMF